MLAGTCPCGLAVTGVPSVIDGDTIESAAGAFGCMASMRRQPDLPGETGQKWRCGQQAAFALQDLIGRRTITCDERDVDPYGRNVGRCLVGDLDINAWLVAQGLALAYRRYSRDYVAAEDAARAAGRGMLAFNR